MQHVYMLQHRAYFTQRYAKIYWQTYILMFNAVKCSKLWWKLFYSDKCNIYNIKVKMSEPFNTTLFLYLINPKEALAYTKVYLHIGVEKRWSFFVPEYILSSACKDIFRQ